MVVTLKVKDYKYVISGYCYLNLTIFNFHWQINSSSEIEKKNEILMQNDI